MAEIINFDKEQAGGLPAAWGPGVTGGGSPKWAVEQDATAPSPPNVARANALENNVSLYYTENGSRKTLKYIDAPVALNAWHTLRVEFNGQSIKVDLDGKTYIDMKDAYIAAAGAIGVWTKADSVTAFDDFQYGPVKK